MGGECVDEVVVLDTEALGFDDELFDLLAEELGALFAAGVGRAATTVPMPGWVSSRPSVMRWATILWAVLGFILRSLLRVRTEGNGSPGRSWPEIMAFLAA